MFGAAGKIILGSTDPNLIVVTQGLVNVSGDVVTGYNDGTHTVLYGGITAIGSRLPVLYKGINIESIIQIDSTIAALDQQSIILTGNITQDFFTGVTFEGRSELLSAAASYLYDATDDATKWAWLNQAIIAEWDGTGDVTALFR